MIDDILASPDKRVRPMTSKNNKKHLVIRDSDKRFQMGEGQSPNPTNIQLTADIHDSQLELQPPVQRQARPNSAYVSKFKKKASLHNSGSYQTAKLQLGFLAGGQPISSQVTHYKQRNKYPVAPKDNPSSKLSMLRLNYSPGGGQRYREAECIYPEEQEGFMTEGTAMAGAPRYSVGHELKAKTQKYFLSRQQQSVAMSSAQNQAKALRSIVNRLEDDLHEQRNQTQYLIKFVKQQNRGEASPPPTTLNNIYDSKKVPVSPS